MASSTSLEALESIDVSRLQQIVLDAIREFGDVGCIADELRSRLPGLAYSSVTARFAYLIDKGLVMVKGSRPGDSGRNQRVMVAARTLSPPPQLSLY
jgi:hypothetical protein